MAPFVGRIGRAAALCVAVWALALATTQSAAAQSGMEAALAKPANSFRIATFNVNLSRNRPNGAIIALRRGDDPQIDVIVEIIQRVRPDVLFLNELDYDPAEEAAALLLAELAVGRNGAAGIGYPHRFLAPANTGAPSGSDLDRDGKTDGPGDAWGWGRHPGQYGMALFSAFPIDVEAVRTFQRARWADLVKNSRRLRAPVDPDRPGEPYYPPAIWSVFPFSSKSHWDAPIMLPSGHTLHVLGSHPTPPVFDGPEDRNGLRNAAEIAFWRGYVLGETPGNHWILDDQGRRGGLTRADRFAGWVVMGDLNLDAMDGDGDRRALGDVAAWAQDPAPRSAGGAEAAALQGGANERHRGDPALDTADWRDDGRGAPGNLRVDYALPSQTLRVLNAGVFWPASDDPLARLVAKREVEGRNGRRFMADIGSDHRLVWVDLALPE